MRCLGVAQNAVYAVAAPDRRRSILRLAPRGPAEVEAELWWLGRLAVDTDLRIPRPVPTREGHLVQPVAIAGLPAPWSATLLHRVEGRPVDADALTTAAARAFGRFIARLHDHAATLRLPPTFARSRLTPGGMLTQWGEPLAALPRVHRDQAAGAQARLLDRLAGEHARALIHADLGPGNLLLARGQPGAIDFDDCAVGPLAYDLAVLLCRLDHRADYPALRRALAAGYAEIRPPPDLELWDDFVRLRRWMRVAWLAQRRAMPGVARELDRVRRAALADLERAP